jgi:hypothetical protein
VKKTLAYYDGKKCYDTSPWRSLQIPLNFDEKEKKIIEREIPNDLRLKII